MAVLPATFPSFEWHSDTFTLPEGAVLLAGSAGAAMQAFRIGRATYGTQFHFEASRAVVADWLQRFPEAVDRIAPGWAQHYAGLAADLGASADAHGLALARAWVALF